MEVMPSCPVQGSFSQLLIGSNPIIAASTGHTRDGNSRTIGWCLTIRFQLERKGFFHFSPNPGSCLFNTMPWEIALLFCHPSLPWVPFIRIWILISHVSIIICQNYIPLRKPIWSPKYRFFYLDIKEKAPIQRGPVELNQVITQGQSGQ